MKAVNKKLRDTIEKSVTNMVVRPEVPAKLDAIEPITDAVLREVAPQIEHLTNSEPWWQSRVTWGAIIAGVAGLFGVLGYSDWLPAEAQGRIVDGIVAAGPLISMAVVLYGRWAAKRPIGR